MSIEAIAFEVGVLLPSEHEEFDFYSCNNKDLPYGFYDENQGLVNKENFEFEKVLLKNTYQQVLKVLMVLLVTKDLLMI